MCVCGHVKVIHSDSQTALIDSSQSSSRSGRPLHLARQPRSPRPTTGPEPHIVPARAPIVRLSPEEIKLLHFKPTVDTIHLSEGTENVNLNCSILVSASVKQDLTIQWMKNGVEVLGSTQADVFIDGKVSLLSTMR